MSAPIPDWAMKVARDTFNYYGLENSAQGLAQRIADAWQHETQVLRCAYCSTPYPPGTPASQAEALTAHIRVCIKHPMRAVEAQLASLRILCGESARSLGQIKDLANVNEPTRQMLVSIGNRLNSASRETL